MNEKTSWNQDLYDPCDKHMNSLLYKILMNILKMDKGGTQINGPNDKKVDDSAQKALYPSDHIDRLYLSRKEGERELKIVLMD